VIANDFSHVPEGGRASVHPAFLAAAADHGAQVAALWWRHFCLVLAWNRRANLTAITDPALAADRHYRDALLLQCRLLPGAVLDVGSGAGYPGIPLAIAERTRAFTLMEPRRKRASFLRYAAAELGLGNVSILEARSDAEPNASFPNVVTRATFSSEGDLAQLARWAESRGQVLALRRAASAPASEVWCSRAAATGA
jgi:16S rRNA (guanine527-N7)-methyltransferase